MLCKTALFVITSVFATIVVSNTILAQKKNSQAGKPTPRTQNSSTKAAAPIEWQIYEHKELGFECLLPPGAWKTAQGLGASFNQQEFTCSAVPAKDDRCQFTEGFIKGNIIAMWQANYTNISYKLISSNVLLTTAEINVQGVANKEASLMILQSAKAYHVTVRAPRQLYDDDMTRKAFNGFRIIPFYSDSSLHKLAPALSPKSPEWTYFEPPNHCFKVKTLVSLQLIDKEPIKHLRGDIMPHFAWFGTTQDGKYAFRIMYTERPAREAWNDDLVERQVKDGTEGELIRVGRGYSVVKGSSRNINYILSIHKNGADFIFGDRFIVGSRIFVLDLIALNLTTPNYNKELDMADEFRRSFELTCPNGLPAPTETKKVRPRP